MSAVIVSIDGRHPKDGSYFEHYVTRQMMKRVRAVWRFIDKSDPESLAVLLNQIFGLAWELTFMQQWLTFAQGANFRFDPPSFYSTADPLLPIFVWLFEQSESSTEVKLYYHAALALFQMSREEQGRSDPPFDFVERKIRKHGLEGLAQRVSRPSMDESWFQCAGLDRPHR